MKVRRSQIEEYRRDGFVRIPGVFTDLEIDQVRATIYRLFRNFVPSASAFDRLVAPWNDPAFDRAMIQLRKTDPNTFGALYDCAQSSIELLKLITIPNSLDIAAAFLDDKIENLSYSGLMLRMDPPQDKRNVLTWHQDHAYFPQNFNDGGRGLVYWVALQDVTEETGAMQICVGSHKDGLVKPEMIGKSDYITSEQRAVPQEKVSAYPKAYGTCKKGDVILMHMDTCHRSGENISSGIRFSAIYRFHRMMADDYVPFTLLYEYNAIMIERAKQAQSNKKGGS